MAKRASRPAGKARRPERFTCLDIAFKNNDQLRTNTVLQIEVAKIEELPTRLDGGVEALKKVKAELKRCRQAVLKYVFEGKLVPEDPSNEPAEKLLERIKAENTATKRRKLEE